MAIAFVGAADLGNNGGAGALTVAYTCGSGANRLLVVGIKGDTSLDLIGPVTYAGQTMTRLKAISPSGSGDRWTYLYGILSPASGANNIVITATNYALATAADYAGVGFLDAVSSASQGGAITSLTANVTVVTPSSWIIMAFGGYQANNPPIADIGATRRAFDVALGTNGIFDSNGAKAPGSQSLTAHYGAAVSDGIGAVIVSVAPALAFGLSRPANLTLGAGGPHFSNPLA